MPQKSAFKEGFARSFFEILCSSHFVLAVFFVLMFTQSRGQNVSACSNADFEMGNFSGWQAQAGICCPINTSPSGFIPGRHSIMTGIATDPNTCGNVTVVAPGGLYSARIGNDQIGAEAEKLSYSLVVSPDSSLFIYKYAVVLEDGNHTQDEQPRFQISVWKASGQLIDPVCGEYKVVADSNLSGFQTCNGNVIYKDWTTVGLDLSAYIGQTLTIEFATGDCRQGAHFGYAYVDAYCAPLQINSTYCSGSLTAVLKAPDGFNYDWNTGETTQSIVLNNPVGGQVYSCRLTSATDCTVEISTVLKADDPIAEFTVTNICYNNADFSNGSVSTDNMPLQSFHWDFGDGTTSDEENPNHSFPTAGTYTVSLSISNRSGCNDTVSHEVTVFPQPTASISYANPFCTSVAAPQSVISTGLNNYSGGTFSSQPGLDLNPVTGAIIPSASVEGIYTVSYLLPPSSLNCRVMPVTTTVVITAAPTASMSYPEIKFCQSGEPQGVLLVGTGAFQGGQFSAIPNGLSIDAQSGMITPTSSEGGIYNVKYAVPASGGCAAFSVSTEITIIELPKPELSDGVICTDSFGQVFRPYQLDTGMSESGYTFEWFRDGVRLDADGFKYEAATPGIYSVIAVNEVTGCRSDEVFATVRQMVTPDNFIASISDNFTENATLTLLAQGGNGPYLFSIDGGPFENTSVYTNLLPGIHTIAVTDAYDCTHLSKEILILDFPKFFTPNNDGYNDSWNISRLRNQPEAQILIYDRYGKLLKQISPAGEGWDGNFKGRPLPSDDYWFTVDYREMDIQGVLKQQRFRSHFSIKR